MQKINVADHLLRWGVDSVKTYAAVRQLLDMIGTPVALDSTVIVLQRYNCTNCCRSKPFFLIEKLPDPFCPYCGNNNGVEIS